MPRAEEQTNLCKYAHSIVYGLVTKKDEIRLVEIRGESDTILELTVADSDAGQVLGRNGKTVDAVRTLLYSYARSNDVGSVIFRVLNTKKPPQQPTQKATVRFRW